LRFRLDDDFRVSSVTTEEGASLLFFRVREQNSIVVSLGSLAGSSEPFSLVTRYSGRHDPVPVEQELVQASTTIRERDDDTFVERPPLVYSSRTSWYPRPPTEDFAPATLVLETPAGWLAVTGGELVSLRTENRRVRSEFRAAQPGKFLTAIVGRLSEIGMRQEGAVAVRGFSTVRSRGEATGTLPQVQRIVAFYEQRFGPCPYPSLAVVVAEAETPGGHSPPGLLYLQQRPPVLRLRSLPDDPANFSDLPGFFVAHEVAHQWWGQGTAPSSYRERWLSEAWAQYAAALWVRESLGEGSFRSMMDRMGRWAFQHDAAGPIHLGQRLGILKGDPRIFRAVVYDKGAWVLHMLRGLLGDEAFFAAARAFLETHRFAKAGTEDFREALEKASGRDLRPHFDRWIYGSGLPRLTFATHTQAAEGGFRTRVDVKAERLPGEMPLQVSLVGPSGRETRRVTLAATGGSFAFQTRERPRRVVLNDDRGLLARVEGGKPPPAQR
jgi:aminopeptidase N